MDIRLKQLDGTDCGATCVASVAKYYNLNLPIAQIRQIAGTDKNGTNVSGMIEAAESFGFDAKAFRGSFQSLFNIPLPAIAHTVIKGSLHHYIVIKSVTKNHIEIMDPGDGKFHKKTHSDFKEEWTGILILLIPSGNFKVFAGSPDHLSRFWNILKPHRGIIALALSGALIYTILGLSTAVFIQMIVDHVIVENNYKLLNLMATGMVLILLLRVVIDVMKNIIILRTGQLIDSRLILSYYKHILTLPQQFFDTMRVGEITSRISDAVKIRLFINDISINLIVSLCMLVSALGLMFTYYWKLALAIFLIVPVYSLIYFLTNRLNRGSQRKLMEDSAELESQLLESLNAMGTIKRFSLEQYSIEKTESKFNILLRSVYTSGTNSLFSATSTEFTSQMFVILLLWSGSGFVLSGQISPGELLSFHTLIGYFTGPVSSLMGMNKVAQDALIASDRLFEIMDLEQEEDAKDRHINLTPQNIGNIRFSGLSFRYGTRDDVFSNLDLEIPLKGLTAIVGESGCGKSSLVALLQNIYPFYAGNIFFGAYSIKNITTSSLREMVAAVPQVTDLFSGSVISNITIGRKEIDMRKVVAICTELGIIDFIDQLPEGFQTNIGENGVTLSGGHRQRISIARALYRDPQILVLDEATSSLDPLSEQHVLSALNSFLKKGKTVILIAHRLSTVQNANRIIVFKNGRVEEEGTHSELMARRSEYHSLWNRHLPRDMDFAAYETA